MATANCCGSRLERITSHELLDGDCRMGRNMAGCGFSVRLLYLPSSTMPTTCTRVPSGVLQYLPAAFVALPKSLLTNSRRSEERRVGKECRSRWSPYH